MQQKPFAIHFVCTGNIYRSRLAEAYLNAKELPHLVASSSGIHAELRENGPISWYAMRILTHNQLIPFMSMTSQRTSTTLLTQADLVVFMRPLHYQYAHRTLHIELSRSRVWDIPDLHEFTTVPLANLTEVELIELSERTYSLIKEQVDLLIRDLVANEAIPSYCPPRSE